MTRDDILAAISAERDRQIDKWGETSEFEPFLPILMEEVGEVANVLNETFLNGPSDYYAEALKTELIQVAACAVKWLEIL